MVPRPDTEMATSQQTSLLSTQKSESGLHAALHPLVLLTISDYITRHTLRNQKGPLVGALLGQQNGREVTVEHAFECKMFQERLDSEWFTDRLQQSAPLPYNSPIFINQTTNSLQ